MTPEENTPDVDTAAITNVNIKELVDEYRVAVAKCEETRDAMCGATFRASHIASRIRAVLKPLGIDVDVMRALTASSDVDVMRALSASSDDELPF